MSDVEVARERLEKPATKSRCNTALGTLAAALRIRPDDLLVDVNTPGISGDAIARLMTNRRRGKHTAIVLSSSKEHAELVALAKGCGAAGAVQKTLDARKLMDQFEACVAAARGQGNRI